MKAPAWMGVACLIALISLPSHGLAASLNDCQDALTSLDNAFPEGLTDTWAERVTGQLDGINAQTDVDALLTGLDGAWSDYDTYLRDPDPDGDGLAMSPDVMKAHTELLACLYFARIAELSPESTEDMYAEDDTETPTAENENLEKPPFPISDPAEWFADLQYPDLAAQEKRSGVTRYDVTVGTDGMPLGCQATGPAGSPDLESATCDVVMAAARFLPATNSDGAAVVGEISGTLKWVVPE